MNDLLPNAVLASQGGDPGKPKQPVVDNKVRQAWNDYVNFLQTKGLKGHPSLDHNDLGFKMIDEYRKLHPDTPLTKDMVIPIQQDFSNYRNWALDQIKQGKGQLQQGVTPDKFLSALSVVDGIPGQRTTSYSFPSGYMKDMNTGQVQNKGFMKAGVPVADQLSSNP